ncbi:site-specific integrase [Bacteroides fluxus]|uniref:Site-specific recombinase, phage integrase family n=1 Tax=Bacteroides fluxus YIT 12057 TaxID=763034 RepID=F3PUU6_9BACE|nr:site-specific integrase [Bacteroides fluxus]EGF55826.1 site-specific recombinase, phage integrase family [Bacteroides fluxus YIT 12057]
MKRSSFNVLFFLKKTKLLKNGETSVCMRITVDGTRVENNIRKSIDPSLWSQAKESARGKSRKSCDLNAYIENARIKLHQIFCELEEQNQPITARLLQEFFFGQDKEPEAVRTLIGTMQEHNDQCRALVGKDYALITVRRYESCKRYLAELIRQKYEKDDLPLAEVNGELVRAFEFYLKTEKECQQNTVIRYMKCLKKITNLALANEWIAKDPFIGIKFHEKEVIREFLTMDELLTIYHKEFPLERITVVRDVFIFAAFTGLAFIDVQQLSPEHIVKDNNGNLWIRKPRQKTKNMCNIPLLDIPLEILRKYADYPASKKKGVLLPVPCNQKMNSYLKEIANLCQIKKNLTTHRARHSYATSVCLANGVSIENVTKMLGHSNIKMTQHYARVLDSSILKDMNNVRSVLSSNLSR